ncbi:MAG: hypothetical protein IID18_09670, partial [Nitrospinae bacterium]|nr:hypothetical protein [Nitrospinota bacterium]
MGKMLTGNVGTMACDPATSIDSGNYFEVRARMWDELTEDYTLNRSAGEGCKLFREFVNANNYFDSLEYSDLCSMQRQDIRLEVIHQRM